MTSVTETDKRAEYIKGLRAFADILEAHTEVPLPFEGSSSAMTIYIWPGEDAREQMAAARRAIGGTWEKGASDSYFNLERRIDGLLMQITSPREQVCERVVVGTHEVTVQEPTGYRTVTKTVEDIKWDCGSLLSDEVSA